MSTKIITLKFSKSTKNTHVYTDDSDDAIVPSVYIKKHGLPSTPPQKIKLTIEDCDDS